MDDEPIASLAATMNEVRATISTVHDVKAFLRWHAALIFSLLKKNGKI
jgi:hypothetical protein